jgi:hypothetical protein
MEKIILKCGANITRYTMAQVSKNDALYFDVEPSGYVELRNFLTEIMGMRNHYRTSGETQVLPLCRKK